jgi:hypothetical protein
VTTPGKAYPVSGAPGMWTYFPVYGRAVFAKPVEYVAPSPIANERCNLPQNVTSSFVLAQSSLYTVVSCPSLEVTYRLNHRSEANSLTEFLGMVCIVRRV